MSIAELDRLQKLKPELKHFIELFFGLDKDDFTEEDVAELGQRLESLPERLKLCKAKRPNLAEVCLSLKNDKQFIHQLKEAVKKRLKSNFQNEKIPTALEKNDLKQKVSPHFDGAHKEDDIEKPGMSISHSPSDNHDGHKETENPSFSEGDTVL